MFSVISPPGKLIVDVTSLSANGDCSSGCLHSILFLSCVDVLQLCSLFMRHRCHENRKVYVHRHTHKRACARFRGLTGWITDHYHMSSNIGVGISEGCFSFDFASLALAVKNHSSINHTRAPARARTHTERERERERERATSLDIISRILRQIQMLFQFYYARPQRPINTEKNTTAFSDSCFLN